MPICECVNCHYFQAPDEENPEEEVCMIPNEKIVTTKIVQRDSDGAMIGCLNGKPICIHKYKVNSISGTVPGNPDDISDGFVIHKVCPKCGHTKSLEYDPNGRGCI